MATFNAVLLSSSPFWEERIAGYAKNYFLDESLIPPPSFYKKLKKRVSHMALVFAL